MKIKLFLISFCFLYIELIKAQVNGDFNYSDISLEKVIFHEPRNKPDHWIRIIKDPKPINDPNQIIDGLFPVSLNPSQTISFESGNENPVAYASGCNGMVSAIFSIKCNKKSFYVKGIGSDGFNLAPKLVNVSNGTFQYPRTELNKSFTNLEVRCFPEFKIQWLVSNEENGNYVTIGESKNPLYVTHKKPLNTTTLIHSFLHISCEASNQISEEDKILEGIYNKLTSKCVKKYNGSKCIQYWGTDANNNYIGPPQSAGNPYCWTGVGLIAWENTTCGAWADFHVELSKTQGLDYIQNVDVTWTIDQLLSSSDINKLDADIDKFFGTLKNKIYYYKNDYKPADFYVNEYNFKNGLRTFYMGERLSYFYNTFSWNGLTFEKADEDGAKAQGNDNPRSYFENHAITKNTKTGKYYDPSYGISTAFNNKEEWRNTALKGFGTRFLIEDINNGNTVYYQISWVCYKTDDQNVIFNK